LLTGQEVFGGRNLVEVCSHHLHSIPVPPSARTGTPIPEDLESVILACLEKSPEKRPRDARTLQSALRACRDARTWSEDDARRWFSAHATQLRDRQSRSEVGSAQTVAVDLGLRVPDLPEQKAG
jgi:serine/threonine-protein kinase